MKVLVFFSSFFLFLCFCQPLIAQIDPNAAGYFFDALRFSQSTMGGSARLQGIGGASTALGGDISYINNNPAGLGFLRKSEFSFSPSVGLLQTNGAYLDQKNNNSLAFPFISNMGIVFSLKQNDGFPNKKWKGGSLGIGVTRFNSFQESFSYEGTNTQTSLTDAFVDEAAGIPASDLSVPIDQIFTRSELAFQAYLINPFDNNNSAYFTWARDERNRLVANILQQGVLRTKGSQSTWNLTYGGNYNDKFYFGASLGVSFLRYFNQHTYKERILYRPNQLKDLIQFSLNDELEVRGSGFNLSTGFIFRPNNWLRVGMQFVSPTWYSLKESYGTDLSSQLDNLIIDGQRISFTNVSIVPGDYQYTLNTPFRSSFGLVFLLGKQGFFTLDAEYADFSLMQLNGNDKALFTAENKTIRNFFKSVINLRAGGEYRFHALRFRLGAGFEDTPYKNADEVNRTTLIFTGGLGYRKDDFYIDFALVNRRFKGIFAPYSLNDGMGPVNQLNNSYFNGILTFGIFFN